MAPTKYKCQHDNNTYIAVVLKQEKGGTKAKRHSITVQHFMSSRTCKQNRLKTTGGVGGFGNTTPNNCRMVRDPLKTSSSARFRNINIQKKQSRNLFGSSVVVCQPLGSNYFGGEELSKKPKQTLLLLAIFLLAWDSHKRPL